jgi:hypothetical protein
MRANLLWLAYLPTLHSLKSCSRCHVGFCLELADIGRSWFFGGVLQAKSRCDTCLRVTLACADCERSEQKDNRLLRPASPEHASELEQFCLGKHAKAGLSPSTPSLARARLRIRGMLPRVGWKREGNRNYFHVLARLPVLMANDRIQKAFRFVNWVACVLKSALWYSVLSSKRLRK